MKNIITTLIFAVVLFSVFVVCLINPGETYSYGERRLLAQMPDVSIESITNGSFMENFEKYATDQFPLRDKFRTVKTLFSMNVLNKRDNNGLFIAQGHISKIDDVKNEYMQTYAAELFEKIISTNIAGKNSKVYFSIVPDKNYLLAENNGYPSMDYEAFIENMKAKTEFMEYIDITEYLSLSDYYTTDTHWRQEKIIDIATVLGGKMGVDIPKDYTENKINNPFYGVYAGQLAMPVKPDEIIYLTNETIDNFLVTYYGTGDGKKGETYNMDKAYGKDPYEMFLSGSEPLITIENTMSDDDRELVIFRDSFASSLAPLLAQGYKKTTVIDIRYMQSSFIGDFVDFDNCDVLFIYSTSVLNSSTSMK